jgi:hypothetical protein
VRPSEILLEFVGIEQSRSELHGIVWNCSKSVGGRQGSTEVNREFLGPEIDGGARSKQGHWKSSEIFPEFVSIERSCSGLHGIVRNFSELFGGR